LQREQATEQGEPAPPGGQACAAPTIRAGLTPAAVLQLQRTAGNAAVTRLVRRTLSRVAAPDRMCCPPESIRSPDFTGTHTRHKLTIAADKESEDFWTRAAGSVGHTWVKFADDAGAIYSYGFYPALGIDAFEPSVPGCVVHPDLSHEPPRAKDYIEIGYEITEEGLVDAFLFAERWARETPQYNLYTWNCTDFVLEIARAAGVEPPDPVGLNTPNGMYDAISIELSSRGPSDPRDPGFDPEQWPEYEDDVPDRLYIDDPDKKIVKFG
jgi:hypothetical protein